jgi:hypothetical protein
MAETGPYSEPDESNPNFYFICFLFILILSSVYAYRLKYPWTLMHL